MEAQTLPDYSVEGYERLESVEFDDDIGQLIVLFGDGFRASFNPGQIVPPTLVDLDWFGVAWNRFQMVVEHSAGWFPIPWDVVRREVDPEFSAFWSSAAAYANNSSDIATGSLREDQIIDNYE